MEIALWCPAMARPRIGRDCLRFRDMLRRIEDRILALVDAQLETGAIMSAQPTAEFDPLWGRGYVTGTHFTRMVLAGMGRN